MLKYLRIAVTALSLTACVLFVALWVRSYNWHADSFGCMLTSDSAIIIASYLSALQLEYRTYPVEYTDNWASPFGWESHVFGQWDIENEINLPPSWPWWFHSDGAEGFRLAVPAWFLVLLSITFATVPWIRWSNRFSLRTLLIATTLVAVGLAVFVAAR